jgi:hypothetical protein
LTVVVWVAVVTSSRLKILQLMRLRIREEDESGVGRRRSSPRVDGVSPRMKKIPWLRVWEEEERD